MARRVVLVTGKRVRPGTILFEVHQRLSAAHADVVVQTVSTADQLLAAVAEAAVIVHRSLGVDRLAALEQMEQQGVRCCNRASATLAVRNRAATLAALEKANLPVPRTRGALTWDDALAAAGDRMVIVKTQVEDTGRNRGILRQREGTLPHHPPFAGPYIVQDFVQSDGRDRKLYVVGGEVRALLKTRSPDGDELGSELYTADRELAQLARAAGAALNLEIYGVDVVCGSRGPVVVDVNSFPGFRGIPDAADLAAAYLLAL